MDLEELLGSSKEAREAKRKEIEGVRAKPLPPFDYAIPVRDQGVARSVELTIAHNRARASFDVDFILAIGEVMAPDGMAGRTVLYADGGATYSVCEPYQAVADALWGKPS